MNKRDLPQEVSSEAKLDEIMMEYDNSADELEGIVSELSQEDENKLMIKYYTAMTELTKQFIKDNCPK